MTQDKYLDGYSKMVPILHAYDRKVPDRTVMAFVPNEELRQAALEAGALHAGGEELILEVTKGRIDLVSILGTYAYAFLYLEASMSESR